MNTTENNKLIAEFMGQEFEASSKEWEINRCLNNGQIEKPFVEHLDYHESWDSLMPVIDKCYQEHTYTPYQRRLSKHIAKAVMTCNIDLAYKVVVEFIECKKNYV